MARKEVFIFLLISLIFFSATFASAVGDVAYLYRKDFRIDENILDVFDEFNLTVDLINENNMPRDFSQYKLLFIGDENFRKAEQIPVNNKRSIIVNAYHTDTWGYTDKEGASQLASSHPLSVVKDGKLIQVYTTADGFSGPSISYYFLDMENRAENMTMVALTEPTASGSDFGDVISYAGPGTRLFRGKVQNEKMCFYGIAETDFWTAQARDLFEDCVGYVAAECTTDSDCPADSYSAPFCQNGSVYRTVTSYSCVKNGLAECVASQSTILVEECAFDCVSGACVGECESNSDCGTDGPVGGPFCTQKNVSQQYELFTCNNASTPNSYCSSKFIVQTTQQCQDACVNGTCFDIECFTNADCNDANASTQDTCHNPGTVESFCTNEPVTCFTNSDCGTDGFIGNPTCIGKNISQPFKSYQCLNPGTVLSSCTSSTQNKVVNTCTDACINGTCHDITCYNDAECNDSNPRTLDQCINPGTIASECRNTPLNCGSNLDCGFTGFLGQEFCTDHTVAKNFQNATCFNPGALNSFCSVTVNPVVLDHCEFSCSNATCIRCASNADCNDNNSQTRDTCHNPGTVQSYCTNQPDTPQNITCTKNSDCGATTILSPPFCSTNDITQLVRTWTCNSPNTTASYCSSNTITNITKQCQNYCINGECADIECFTHADCNDNNSQTLDICNNPGTPQSFCTNTPIEVVCNSDADCGTDGFVGNNVCAGKNLTKLFQDFTCNFPGTQQSYCSSSATQMVIQECSFLCSDGQCIPEQGECTPGSIKNCGTDVGECSAGVQLCLVDAHWSQTCFGAINPSTEICDAKDNDCDGAVDEGGVCGVICTNECTSGNRDCSVGGYRTCGNYDNDTCTEWSQITNCSSGEVCQSGYCVSSCSNECIAGNRQCSGNGYQTCGNYDSDSCTEWSSVSACAIGQICDGGYCVSTCSNLCISGQRQCSGNGYQLCGNYDSDVCTEWSSVTECLSGQLCELGFCINSCSDECTSGSRQCNGNGFQLCGNYDSDSCKEWSSVTQCGTGELCQSGYCTSSCSNECALGSKQCSGNGYQTCGNYDSDICTEWSSTTNCGANQICQSGQCVNSCSDDCTLGQTQCNGNGYQTCGNYDSDSCTDWSSVTQCSSGQTCQSGQCINSCTNECAASSQECLPGGNSYRFCGYYDSDSCTEWSSAINCGANQVCQGGQCLFSCSNECTQGQTQCNGNGYQLCGNYDSDSCTEWSSVTQCSSGQTCQSGSCVSTCSNDCTLGSRQCSGNGYKLCGYFDSDSCTDWSSTTSCSTGETCSSGYCVPTQPSCSDDCTLGSRQCSGNGYKLCGYFDTDSCTDWSSTTTCSTGQTCSSGYCVTPPPSCTNDCTLGSRQCSGNGYKLCGYFDTDSCTDWSLVTTCSTGKTCSSGYCI